MNLTIKDSTVERFYYATHDQLRTHLADFVSAYNFGRRLKTLKGLTPYEYVCKLWTKDPRSASRRVTCRRNACVGSSGTHTSGRSPLA